jgi:hypothetical protein
MPRRKSGRPAPERINVYLPPQLHARLKALLRSSSAPHLKSKNSFALEAIRRLVEDDEERRG